MFPGDTSAPDYLVYNCRCTTVAKLKGMPMGKRRYIEPETGESKVGGGMTYSEWERKKSAEDPHAFEVYMKKGKSLSSDRKQFEEYKAILGKNIPSTLDAFQNMKYNNPERWKMLKLDKIRRQELRKHPDRALPGDIKTAPDAKFTKYLFNPNNHDGWAKGRNITARLGYSTDNREDLRKEIMRAQRRYPAVAKSADEYGTRYEQAVILYGKTNNPTNAIIAWILTPDGETRMTTAYIKEV